MSATDDNAPKRGLGRGLSALFGEDDKGEGGTQAVTDLPIHVLKPGRFQPRRHFDDAALESLIASVREKGVLEPLLVRRLAEDAESFEIVAGERRWRAAQAAQLHRVPVVVKEIDDRAALEIALIENLHREDLSPLEEAEAYQRLMSEFGHTQERLAASIGKSRSHVANTLRLLTLPKPVQQFVLDGQLSAGHARALITASDPEGLAKQIVAKGLSVRQAERLAKSGGNEKKLNKIRIAVDNVSGKDPNTAALEKSLSDKLGLKVSIDDKGEAGSIRIDYQTLEQLDDLLQILSR
jgi:ParB family chromosome partitioning protein